ncbi:hypothetical protein [Streptomyces sp. NPDC056663]|uniref:hypothetical protein n=1 Tax=Streptomyces sp. NPDC056663 TaxID=3345899 RepID=UPI00368D4994
MTTHPRIGSIWAVRFPDAPQHDYKFRVTGVFTKDGVTYVEEERLGSGGLRRGRLEDILAYAEPSATKPSTAWTPPIPAASSLTTTRRTDIARTTGHKGPLRPLQMPKRGCVYGR